MKARANLAAGALMAFLAPCAAAQASERLVLKNLRAHVEIIAENRPDVVVTLEMNGSGDPEPQITRSGDTVTVSGRLQTERPAYRVAYNLDPRLDVAGMKAAARQAHVQPEGIPTILFRAPLNLRIRSNAQVFGHIGPCESLRLEDHGAGFWRIDAVAGTARIDGEGDADFTIGKTGSVEIQLMGTGNAHLGDTGKLWSSQWGSGDVVVTRVAQIADVELSGIGDFEAEALAGRLSVQIDDKGSVQVRDGDLASLKVRSIDGLGEVRFGGVVKDADINIGTETRVSLHKVTGALKKTLRQQASVVVDAP
jgi:hypothetical protein